LRLERVLQVQDLFAEGEVLGEDARAVGFEGADADRLLRIDPVILSAMHSKLSLAAGGRVLCQLAVLAQEAALHNIERVGRRLRSDRRLVEARHERSVAMSGLIIVR
jgi:hypothetical protein